jgi:hypothetical protein
VDHLTRDTRRAHKSQIRSSGIGNPAQKKITTSEGLPV